MPGLNPTQIIDNTVATLKRLNKGKTSQTQKYQHYALVGNLWLDDVAVDSVREGAGTQYSHRVRVRPQNGWRMSGLFAVETTSRDDTMVEGTIPWRKWSQNSLVFDYDESVFNSGEARIVDYIEQIYNGADENTWNRMEEQSFLAPNSSTDGDNFHGLLYWMAPVAQGTSDPIGGFNGSRSYYRTAGSGSTTTIGGVDRSLAINSNMRNWCATSDGTFGAATRELVARGLTDCKFMSLPGGSFKGSSNRDQRFVLMLNSNHFHEYERDVNLGPDDKGGDLRKFNTTLKFRGVPITQAFVFDQIDVAVTSQNPGNNILFVNTGELYAFKESATFNKDMTPITNYDSPTEFRIHRRGWGNLFGRNPRLFGGRIAPAF